MILVLMNKIRKVGLMATLDGAWPAVQFVQVNSTKFNAIHFLPPISITLLCQFNETQRSFILWLVNGGYVAKFSMFKLIINGLFHKIAT